MSDGSAAKEPQGQDIRALADALAVFTETSQRMEEAYRGLERRIAELDKELAQKNHELALTSDYLSNVLESISDGVIAVNSAGKITHYNRAARAILGYDAGEVVGQRFDAIFGRSFATPRSGGENIIRAKSGRNTPVNERDATIAGADGTCQGWVKTFQDLSEIRALREQMRQRERLAAIGEMAATVAHEIRNPLGGIRGFAALLTQDIPPEDSRRRLVDKILIGTQNLDRVVSELLEYTRPVEVRLQAQSCTMIVQQAIAFIEYDCEDIEVIVDAPEEVQALADIEKMRQVLLNLILNAIQSIEGTGEVRITISAKDHREVAIAITDNGCGVPKEYLDTIFSPFFTTKQKGTGLGLAVCQKIVEVHGGHLTAESEEGIGSVFTVILPRAG